MSNYISYSAIFMSIVSSHAAIIHSFYNSSEIGFYFHAEENESLKDYWVWVFEESVTINDESYQLPSEMQEAMNALFDLL